VGKGFKPKKKVKPLPKMDFLKKKLFGGRGLKTNKNSKTPSVMDVLKKKVVWGERA